MPDPLLYLRSLAAAALVSTLVALACGWWRRKSPLPVTRWMAIIACVAGLIAGDFALGQRLAWPPLGALDRMLTIVLPAAIMIEVFACAARVPAWLAWALRIALAVALGRVLLHGSVYISPTDPEWTAPVALLTLLSCGLLLGGVWALLAWLARRSPPGGSLPLALALTLATSGVTIMVAGYVKGGAAAFPVAASLAGAVCGARLLRQDMDVAGLIGIGVVGLGGLVFIGRYFGGLSTGVALTLVLAPLLCWITELPWLRQRSPWIVGSARLICVAMPLVIILLLAKLEFDRETAPLIMQRMGLEVAR